MPEWNHLTSLPLCPPLTPPESSISGCSVSSVSPVSPAVGGNSRAGITSLSPPLPPLPWCLFLCLLLDFRGDSRTPPSPSPSPPLPFRFRGSVMSQGTRISTGSPPRNGRGEHCGVSWLVTLRRTGGVWVWYYWTATGLFPDCCWASTSYSF